MVEILLEAPLIGGNNDFYVAETRGLRKKNAHWKHINIDAPDFNMNAFRGQ